MEEINVGMIDDIREVENIIADEEMKIEQTYFEIGKLYYSLHSADPEEPFKPYVSELIEANSRIVIEKWISFFGEITYYC